MVMNGLRLDTNWRYRGFEVIILENSHVRVDVMPELGGRIYNFVLKQLDLNLLWHNPRIELRKVPLGANYNDNYVGGWDELFPNDAPVEFQDESLPDHGELWSQAWDHEVVEKSAEAVSVRLRRFGSVTQTLVEKTLTLRRDEPMLHVHYRLTNLSDRELLFMWKLHPSFAIGPDHRIDVGAKKVVLADLGSMFRSRFGGQVREYTWPIAKDSDGKQYDMRSVLPPQSKVAEMHFCIDLRDGWCAVTDTQRKAGFGLRFDKDLFTTLWLVMLYGGWRGLYHVILEPSTAYPRDLREAAQRGRIGRLGGGETQETDVLAVAYSGKASVGRIRPDGSVE